MDYLYTETPRLTFGASTRNKIAPAPLSDSGGENSFDLDHSHRYHHSRSHQHSREAVLDHSLLESRHDIEDDEDEEGSAGFMTAYSRSRSRSVAG